MNRTLRKNKKAKVNFEGKKSDPQRPWFVIRKEQITYGNGLPRDWMPQGGYVYRKLPGAI